MLSALERERAAGFKNLSGTHLDVTVPVTQRLLDLLLARAASRQLGNVTVMLRGTDAIAVTVVKPVLGFAARLGLDLRLEGGSDLASDPRVYLVVDRPSVAWRAISRIAVAAGLTPAGVEIGRDGVAIDLRALGTRAGIGDLVSGIRAIAFEVEPGVLRVRIAVQIPEGGLAAARQGPAGLANAPLNAWLEPEDVLPELRGARVRGRVVATEGLVNEVLGTALEAARRDGQDGVTEARAISDTATGAAPALDARMVARWIQRATIRFEHGKVVLEPDIEIG
jgi:hypothetical protein